MFSKKPPLANVIIAGAKGEFPSYLMDKYIAKTVVYNFFDTYRVQGGLTGPCCIYCRCRIVGARCGYG